VIFFCSSSYELASLGPAIAGAFPAIAVVGCTSSGQIGSGGFQLGGLSGVSLAGDELVMSPMPIVGLEKARTHAAALARTIHDRAPLPRGWRSFGLLLVDGLSLAEERLTSALYENLRDVPLVGGSAGDDLRFARTHVYYDGAFHTDAAVFTVFDTSAPFEIFRFQHFEPTATTLVISDADPENRVVREINGQPAAMAYAAAVGVPVEALTAEVFSDHPLLVNLGGDHYVRSISRVDANLGLVLLCAIEDGLVVRLGRGVDVTNTAERALRDVSARVAVDGTRTLLLGCDCILRRLEFQNNGVDAKVGALYAELGVFGFSTYGEQYNGVHVNQTFTGIALGGVA
jgi:hypothetical protein